MVGTIDAIPRCSVGWSGNAGHQNARRADRAAARNKAIRCQGSSTPAMT
jgi:hypothetical protein